MGVTPDGVDGRASKECLPLHRMWHFTEIDMLALEMTNLSEEELEDVVAEYCSFFGCVKILNVLAPRNQNHHGAAAVRMSTEAEAEELAKNVGGSRCGSKVIIKLAQQGRHISTITRKNFFQGPEAASVSPADLPLTGNHSSAEDSTRPTQRFPHEDRSFWGLALAGD